MPDHPTYINSSSLGCAFVVSEYLPVEDVEEMIAPDAKGTRSHVLSAGDPLVKAGKTSVA